MFDFGVYGVEQDDAARRFVVLMRCGCTFASIDGAIEFAYSPGCENVPHESAMSSVGAEATKRAMVAAGILDAFEVD